MFSVRLLTALIATYSTCTSVLALEDASTITAAPSPTVAAIAKRATASPLTDYLYPYSAVPYQVNPFPPATAGGRGPQTGYNRCNASTEGPNSGMFIPPKILE